MKFEITDPIIERGCEALFGQHPERGGQERRQAVFSVLTAVMPDLIDMVAESWKEYRQNTFSGGMIPFDSELSKNANAHLTQGQREELGVDAVFKSFLNFLRSKL